MKHILFIRLSTEEQAKDDKASIDMQINKANAYLNEHGHKPLLKNEIFIEIISGYTNNKSQLETIKKLAKKEKFNLLVWAIDRLGRDAEEGLRVSREFLDMGIKTISLTEPFDASTPEGKFFLTMLLGKAELEGTTIRRRMLGGRYAKVERDGTSFGAIPPFGYKSLDRKFVIVEEEAIIVKRVYELYLYFKSDVRVRQKLEEEGVKARVKLDRRQIKRILTNVKYTGRMKVKDRVYDQKHAPIVSIDTFDKVQAIRKKNFGGSKINWSCIAPELLLRDVTVCGFCGRSVVKAQGPVQKKSLVGKIDYYKYYVCASTRRKEYKGTCKESHAHRKEKLEAEVIERVFTHIDSILSDEKYMVKHLDVTTKEEINSIKRQIEAKKKALKQKNKAGAKWLEVFEQSDTNSEDFLKRYNDIQADIKELKANIVDLETQLLKQKNKKDDFKNKKHFYKEVKKNWEEASPLEKRDMINSLVRVIRVYRKENPVEIEYNF